MSPTVSNASGPFLGLRPFEEADQGVFSGRQVHVDEVLSRLNDHRFVAIVGLSGSGKSSLVKAGVIPKLRADRLKNTSSNWLVVVSTPSTAPIERLGHQLKIAVHEYRTADNRFTEEISQWVSDLDATLNSGSLGLSQGIRSARLPERTQVLLVIDQFEELFRYQRRSKQDEAETFVQHLLETSSDKTLNTFVIITMRSEYLGECARYEGLAEVVNAGLYLTPRLSRDQLQEAIVFPAEKFGGQVKIVNRLINAVANDPDQLPVLQHALMLCWELGNGTIDKKQYEDVGGTNSLDWHAERVLREKLDPDPEKARLKMDVAEKLFKRITKAGRKEGMLDAEKDGLRDPATLCDICRQIGYRREEVEQVIEVFRQAPRAFLRPEAGVPLENDSIIDITHESLIRKWKTLQKWVQEETDSAHAYARLVEEAGTTGNRDVLRRRDVALYLGFEESGDWSEAWAERYGGNYSKAIQYLHHSQKHYQRKFWLWAVAVVLSTILIALLVKWVTEKTKNKVIGQTRAYEDLIDIAHAPNLSMEDRVSAALGAYRLGEGLGDLHTLKSKLPLTDWELFSALQKKVPAWPKVSLKAGATPIISGGVSLDSRTKRVALATGTGIQVLSLPSGEQVAARPFEKVERVRLSPNGELLIASGASSIQRFGVRPNSLEPLTELNFRLRGDEEVKELFIADSGNVAVLTSRGRLMLSPEKDQPEKFSPDAPVLSAAFSSTGGYLLLSQVTGVSLIDLNTLNRVKFGPQDDPINAAIFSQDSSLIATGSQRGVLQVRRNPLLFPGGNSAKNADGPRSNIGESVSAVNVTPDGKWIAAGTYSGNAYVYRSGPNEREYLQQGPKLIHQGPVTSVSFLDRNTLLTSSVDEKARVFDIGTGVEQFRIPHDKAVIFATSLPREKDRPKYRIISASQDSALHLTELPVSRLKWFPDSCSPEASAIWGDGEWVWACRGELRIREHGNGSVEQEGFKTVLSRLGKVVLMNMTADGKALTFIDQVPGGFFRFHAVFSPQPTAAWKDQILDQFPPSPTIPSTAASPDGRRMATISQVARRQWKVRVFEMLEPGGRADATFRTSEISIDKVDQVASLAVASDGSIAVGSGKDLTVYPCSSTGVCREVPLGDRRLSTPITALAFMPSGNRLLAGTGNGTIYFLSGEEKPVIVAPNAPASYFVLNSDGTVFAAVGLYKAKFFELTKGAAQNRVPFREFTSLSESGPIQALSFSKTNLALTSVQYNNPDRPLQEVKLVRIRHDLTISGQRKIICDRLPDNSHLQNVLRPYWSTYDIGDAPADICPAQR